MEVDGNPWKHVFPFEAMLHVTMFVGSLKQILQTGTTQCYSSKKLLGGGHCY